jgi:hypothetical protein
MSNFYTPHDSFTTKLVFNGQCIDVDIACQITGKYAYLNKCCPSITEKPVFHLDIDVVTPIAENNLLLLKFSDSSNKCNGPYILLTTEQFKKRLAKERSIYLFTKTLVCCPYNRTLIQYIMMVYPQISRTNLSFYMDTYTLKELVMLLVKSRILEHRKKEEEKLMPQVEENIISNGSQLIAIIIKNLVENYYIVFLCLLIIFAFVKG